MKNITLYSSRISCASVPATLKGVIMSLKGVLNVNVLYEDQALNVKYEEKEISLDEIIAKIGQETGILMRQERIDVDKKNIL
jgi:copper chaperone CopZ